MISGRIRKSISSQYDFTEIIGNGNFIDEEIHCACKLLEKTKNIPLVVKEAGISRDYLYDVINTRSKTYNDEDIHKACRMILDNYSYNKISEVTGFPNYYLSMLKMLKVRPDIGSKYFS